MALFMDVHTLPGPVGMADAEQAHAADLRTQERYGVTAPRIGLLSIGEEAAKGNPLVKETFPLLSEADLGGGTFIGNVEGRDVMTDDVDVVVTDGFTGNVVLKTLEGGLRALVNSLFAVFGSTDEAKQAAEVLMPALLPLYAQLDPDSYGGAMLLGAVDDDSIHIPQNTFCQHHRGIGIDWILMHGAMRLSCAAPSLRR